MARATKHQHKYAVISYSLDPKKPSILYGCVNGTCIDTQVVCPLCSEDGNRRRHRTKHNPVKDRETFNRSLLALTKAAIEYEKRWGKPVEHQPCKLHDESHWYTGVSGNRTCGVCHPMTVEVKHGGSAPRVVGGAGVRSDDERLPQETPDRETRNSGQVGEPGR